MSRFGSMLLRLASHSPRSTLVNIWIMITMAPSAMPQTITVSVQATAARPPSMV
ncbi:hypothetical protein D3C85_1682080 [compost metagenome]